MIFNKFPEIIFAISKTSDGNMSFLKGDYEEVLKNRLRFFRKLGIDLNSIAEVKQVHSNKVIFVKGLKEVKDIEADGLITKKSEIYLIMKVADCIPLGIYDPTYNAIGLIHVGYKGLEKGIIKNVIKSMSKNFNTNPKNLIVHFGPSIGPCHYRMDIWKEAENQLIRSGVLKKNIFNPKVCTYESKDYFSHRRSIDQNEPEGRFVTVLGI